MSREWTHYNYYADPRDEPTGVTIEWEADTGGYDWECWALLSKKQGDVTLYAAYNDSGCSCVSSFEDHPDEYDLAWAPNLKEVASTLSRLMRDIEPDERWGITADEKASMLADFSRTVMKLR
jgi:hypothetical protein